MSDPRQPFAVPVEELYLPPPSHLIYAAVGEPDPRRAVEPCDCACFWCGRHTTAGAPIKSVVDSTTFNNWDKVMVRDATHVCPACCWVTTGRPPDAIRPWSILYREDRPAAPSHPAAQASWAASGRLHAQNKADPTAFVDALLNPPFGRWAMAICDSGQIHVIPFARLNTRRDVWEVRFERLNVRGTPRSFAAVYGAASRLYEIGFAKEDIATGQPHPSKLVKYGIDVWAEQDAVLKSYRGGALMELALFLLRKSAAKEAKP